MRLRADPKAVAIVDLFEALLDMRGLEYRPVINARIIHGLFEVKMPYPLWLSYRVTGRAGFEQGSDYRLDRDHKGNTAFVTTDVARAIAPGCGGKIGAYYAVLTAARFTEMLKEPKYAHLQTMQSIMAEAERWSEQNKQLRDLMG